MRGIVKLSVMLVALLLLFQGSCFAGPRKKLERGLANTASGWMEIFTTPKSYSDEHGPAAGFFFGVPAGLAKAFWRTAVGLYETVTFPLPLHNYQPVMEPEFVLDDF